MRIDSFKVRKIFDSRGEPTLQVSLMAEGVYGVASVPSGKSRGRGEANVVPFPQMDEGVALVEGKLIGQDFGSMRAFDEWLLALDGTPQKERLGGNLTLGLSMAFARVLAEGRRVWLSRLLREEFFAAIPEQKPLIFSNLINGGAHSENNLDIQEYLAVARPMGTLTQSVEALLTVYRKLGETLKKKFQLKSLPLGDEGGYSLDFADNGEPLRLIGEAIKASHLERNLGLALDAAADGFVKNGEYCFGGGRLTADQLKDVYLEYFSKNDLLFSIEDPFAESDVMGFKALSAKLPSDKWVVGDDLTVTRAALIADYGRDKLINAVIIKPNQIGTVSETAEAVRTAKEGGLRVIVSHRSGETVDNFIIHLAKAGGADGVKIGAPARERIYKFDKVIELYD